MPRQDRRSALEHREGRHNKGVVGARETGVNQIRVSSKKIPRESSYDRCPVDPCCDGESVELDVFHIVASWLPRGRCAENLNIMPSLDQLLG